MVESLIMPITITKTAADHVHRHILDRGKGSGVRLGVKTTGCAGLAYVIEFADKIEEDDKVFETLFILYSSKGNLDFSFSMWARPAV